MSELKRWLVDDVLNDGRVMPWWQMVLVVAVVYVAGSYASAWSFFVACSFTAVLHQIARKP